MRNLVVAALALVAAPSIAQVSVDYAAQARLAYAAVRCEEFAEMASLDEKTGDAGRLFAIGYRALQVVFEARHRGVDMAPDTKEPHWIILSIRLGPTAEFDVGSPSAAIRYVVSTDVERGRPSKPLRSTTDSSGPRLLDVREAARRLGLSNALR